MSLLASTVPVPHGMFIPGKTKSAFFSVSNFDLYLVFKIGAAFGRLAGKFLHFSEWINCLALV